MLTLTRSVRRNFRGCLMKFEQLQSFISLFSSAAGNEVTRPRVEMGVKIHKAVKAYLAEAKKHGEFMKMRKDEYELGKRFLANMMHVDPDNITEDVIDEAIAYIFPSGLFQPRAKPRMQNPEQIFLENSALQLDEQGRPNHYLFYTTLPHYYDCLHNMAVKLRELNKYQQKMRESRNGSIDSDHTVDLQGTKWMTKEQIEKRFTETLTDDEYAYFLVCMNRLVSHPYSRLETDFIKTYTTKLSASQHNVNEIPKLLIDDDGRPYMEAMGGRRHCKALVVVKGNGTGKMEIDGQDISYFSNIQDRTQLLFPLAFSKLLGVVDIKATMVVKSGFTTEAGAIRHGISLAILSFVSPEMAQRMRLAGLLTRDPRCHERKKPGQKGPRAKYTWRKR